MEDKIINLKKVFQSQDEIIHNLKLFVRNFENIINNIKKSLEEFKDDGFFILLNDYGWFINFSFTISFTNYLNELIKQEKFEEVDDILTKEYVKMFEHEISILKKNFPHREKIFNEIKFLHEKKCFYAGINLILSQIDGLFFDKLGKSFFIKDGRKKIIDEIKENLIDNSIVLSFLNSFEKEISIYVNTRDLNQHSSKLNRHGVLHGIFVDYNTEINFFKSFSLLSLVNDLLN